MEHSTKKYQTFLIANKQSKKAKSMEGNVEIQRDSILEFNSLLKQNLNKNFSDFADIVISFLSANTQACTGIYYAHNFEEATYHIEASYGINTTTNQNTYSLGEGLVGQVIQSGKVIKTLNLPPQSMLVEISNFKLSIHSLYIIPIIFNNKVYGAIQLNFLQKPDSKKIDFLEEAIIDLSSMIENVFHYQYISKLLNESELQKQQLESSELKLSRKLEELSSAKEELDQQIEITDAAYKMLQDNYAQLMQNIKYAYKIKQTFLPQEKILQNAFFDYFTIYLPKDTVSGDFYWYNTFNDIQIIAVGDCTGHGVAGSFMSLFAINLLNQVVSHKKISQPQDILEHLRKEVSFFLKQEGKGLDDGFDISICYIEKAKQDNIYLTYAGAKSSIFYTQKGQVKQVKGDRIAIGGVYNSQINCFTSKRIELRTGEKIYFYTDGIIHMCNNKRKSYGAKSFNKFIIRNMLLPMEKQKQNLEQEIKIYQGTQQQRDDITILGITLN